MNRVAIILDKNGHFDGVVGDSEVEFFVIDQHTPSDRVYKYSSGLWGPQHVREAFDGNPVGHRYDGTLGDGDGTGKLPPSKPSLTVV